MLLKCGLLMGLSAVSETDVTQHIYHVQEALQRKKIPYDFCIAPPVEGGHRGLCRRYELPRFLRDNERVRLDFLQVFNANRSYNQALEGYTFKMSVVYEHRNFLSPESYPTGIENDHVPSKGPHGTGPFSPNPVQELAHFPDLSDPTLMGSSPVASNSLDATTPREAVSPTPHEPRETLSPPRLKAIPKPEREVTKNAVGQFCCTFSGCEDEVKVFGRKCEWSKHMDKHDRPYKCPAPGCEKLPGFTYSGGLLRHEREVHNKHGGPKNPLNCPHVNCKRHTGKGFSRLENLNEHLRRVHTSELNGQIAEDCEDLEEHTVLPAGPKPGEKRKRDLEDDEPRNDVLQNVVKRLTVENHELRGQLEAQKRAQIAMMQELEEMRQHRCITATQEHITLSK
ncbi:hypothetical protein F5Y15DRAFT_16305 [Xylariaceae sp. FL0016]|nr:hypothetical protein F5Y15DRAFT_16305 [Xylariaceae sp. FL0016]